MKIPFLSPAPPELSRLREELAKIEKSGIYSNYGPTNSEFEKEVVQELFGGRGKCVTVCNATIGLMLAIKEAVHFSGRRNAKYALVPSFTFAATAHAAMWCGLTPVFYDVDPESWLPSSSEEDRLIEKYGDDLAVVVPYATFGNPINVSRYNRMSREYGLPVVIDAAASLGSKSNDGHGFGEGSQVSLVYSMHATKTFSTAEAGLIYTADENRAERIRSMGNFGFSLPRIASLPGLNSKLAEVGALLALKKLSEIKQVVEIRTRLYEKYRELLPELVFQKLESPVVAHQFIAALLPPNKRDERADLLGFMASQGIGVANYFSPHLAEQPYFEQEGIIERLVATNMISEAIISLPLFDSMTTQQVSVVCQTVRQWLNDG